MSHIRLSLSSLSVSLIIQIENFGRVETFLAKAKDFVRVAEWNQDFVAPTLCHMPIAAVSVRVREHPQEERPPSGVVSWTECVERENE